MTPTISYGETLMKMMLDRIVPKTFTVINNYRPDWLTNPHTGCRLELDRYYESTKRRVGFEFQGDQHYTDCNQRRRDKLKHKLCKKRGVMLVVVSAHDLTWRIMRAKVSGTIGKQRRCNDPTIAQMTREYQACLRRKGLLSADIRATKLRNHGAVAGRDKYLLNKRFCKRAARKSHTSRCGARRASRSKQSPKQGVAYLPTEWIRVLAVG